MNKFYKVSKDTYQKATKVSEQVLDLQYESIKIPTRSTANSAGYDISTPENLIIEPYSTQLIPTGIKVELDPDKVLQIYPRSSIGIKRGLMISNTVAIIDSDYFNNSDNEGHIFISLRNMTDEVVSINAGERIAQGIFTSYYITDDDNASGTREGGIGSTGK